MEECKICKKQVAKVREWEGMLVCKECHTNEVNKCFDEFTQVEIPFILTELEYEQPYQEEWIPIGIYDGTDLPDTEIDPDYVVWVKTPNPEHDCQVNLSPKDLLDFFHDLWQKIKDITKNDFYIIGLDDS